MNKFNLMQLTIGVIALCVMMTTVAAAPNPEDPQEASAPTEASPPEPGNTELTSGAPTTQAPPETTAAPDAAVTTVAPTTESPISPTVKPANFAISAAAKPCLMVTLIILGMTLRSYF